MRPPRWSDEDAQFEWVKRRLSELRGEYTAAIFTGRRDQLSEELKAMDKLEGGFLLEGDRDKPVDEQEAVDAAKRGDLWPLARLLMPDPSPDPVTGEVIYDVNDRVAHLRPETYLLVIEFLLGERSLNTGRKYTYDSKTGQKKEKRGPRFKTPDQRRKLTPTHDAAKLVPVIRQILRSGYPKQKADDINKRAVELAAEIKSVPWETLASYMGRGPGDRHRL
jgi:hypothetical protein